MELSRLHPLTCILRQLIVVQLPCPGCRNVRREVQQEQEFLPIFSGRLQMDAGWIVTMQERTSTALQLQRLQSSIRPRMIAAQRQTLGLTSIIVYHVLIQPLTKVIQPLQEQACGLLIIKMVSVVKIAIPQAPTLRVSGPTMVQ